MSKTDAQRVLAAEILRDGQLRAERTLTQADAEAQKVLAKAKADAQAESGKILRVSHARAERQRQMILHTVEQEIARRKLRAREKVVQAVIQKAQDMLRDISGEQYKEAIVRLAVDGICQVPAESLILNVANPSGEKLHPENVASDVADALAREGRKVTVRVVVSDHQPRGVVAESADGRMRCDNSFDERLRRLRATLRRQIAPLLFEKP